MEGCHLTKVEKSNVSLTIIITILLLPVRRAHRGWESVEAAVSTQSTELEWRADHNDEFCRKSISVRIRTCDSEIGSPKAIRHKTILNSHLRNWSEKQCFIRSAIVKFYRKLLRQKNGVCVCGVCCVRGESVSIDVWMCRPLILHNVLFTCMWIESCDLSIRHKTAIILRTRRRETAHFKCTFCQTNQFQSEYMFSFCFWSCPRCTWIASSSTRFRISRTTRFLYSQRLDWKKNSTKHKTFNACSVFSVHVARNELQSDVFSAQTAFLSTRSIQSANRFEGIAHVLRLRIHRVTWIIANEYFCANTLASIEKGVL